MQGFTTNDVPANFVPVTGTHYRIVSIADPSKCLTVAQDHGLLLKTYTGDASQRFTVMPQNGKFAFIVQSTSTALCVYLDNKQDGGLIKVDGGKHDSSWFQVRKVGTGEYAGKGYGLFTFAEGRSITIHGGTPNEGATIDQWGWCAGKNQVWLILPADQQANNTNQWGNQSQGFNNQNQGFNNQPQNQWGHQSESHGHHGKGHHGKGHHGPEHHEPDHKSGQGFNTGGQVIINTIGQGFGGQGFKPNQGFGVEMVGNFKKGFTYAFLSAANQHKCILINHDGHAKIFDFQGSINEKFIFESYDKQHDTYVIKSLANGQYLSAPGLFAGGTIGTKPKHQFGENWKLAKSCHFQPVGDAVPYVFRSFSSHVIDIPGGNTNNGNQLEKHGEHGQANQVWYVVEK